MPKIALLLLAFSPVTLDFFRPDVDKSDSADVSYLTAQGERAKSPINRDIRAKGTVVANAAKHQSDDDFTLELIRIQQRLRGFLRCLLVEPDKLDDLLQETNRVLLRKSASYRPGTDFWAWACQVARFEVMAHHRNRQRDRNLFFDAELIDDLAERAEARLTNSTEREEALRECLQQLSEKNTRLIKSRYAQGQSVDGIANSIGRPAGSIRQTLYRIRQQLRECIELRLEEAHS